MTNTEYNHKKDNLFESTDFNKKIIDSLPGIFYLYRVTNEGIFLKRWNKKFATELGYSDQELWNISVSVFFTKKEFIRVEKAIREVLVKGWNDIHSTLITKAGKRIPYYYQGYALYINGETYFMGVGINMSEQHELKKKLMQSEKQHLKEMRSQSTVHPLKSYSVDPAGARWNACAAKPLEKNRFAQGLLFLIMTLCKLSRLPGSIC